MSLLTDLQAEALEPEYRTTTARGAGAIDDGPAAQDEVVGGSPLLRAAADRHCG